MEMRHFLNLLGTSWAFLVSALGTTSLSVILFSFGIPILSGGIAVFVGVCSKVKQGNTVWSAIRQTIWDRNTATAVIIPVIVWLFLMCWAIVQTVYQDHHYLVDARSKLSIENGDLKHRLLQPATSSSPADSKVVTKSSPNPLPEKRCWINNHFGMPNSTIPGAVTATAAIVHCNYKIEAPFEIKLQFDRDFIPGATVLPSASYMIGGGNTKAGNVVVTRIDSPALLSEQLAIVTVYGTTDQYPRALSGTIKTLQ